jgi:hypothetical protein
MTTICKRLSFLKLRYFVVSDRSTYFLASPIFIGMSLIVLNVLNEVVSLVLLVKQSLSLDFVLLHRDVVSIVVVLSVDLVLLVNVKRFREKHCWNADQSD